jgi:hypothetical protein
VKYGDHVRAIKFGEHGALWRNSRENTAKSNFKIVSEGAVAAGFDVSAITGDSVKGFCCMH